MKFTLCCTTLIVSAVSATPASLRGIGPDKLNVIVALKEDKVTGPAKKCARLGRANGGSVKSVYHKALNGCSMTVPRRAIEALSNNPSVDYVEEVQAVRALADESPASWGLDRIDQCDLPLSDSEYTQRDAAGVRVFILDTGIQGSNVHLSAYNDENSSCHRSFINGEGDPLDDGRGHGYVTLFPRWRYA